MIPNIKRILYTTDLSDNARYAFGYAASVAHRYGATIAILHVLEEMSHNTNLRLASMIGTERWQEIQNRNEREVLLNIRDRIDHFCEEMQSELAECPFIVDEIIVKQGVAVPTILDQIERCDCDLVVMGTHGQGLLADAMMGSTARRVVRRSLTPVMVIRLPEED
jgi:nucleotide-binding universal stress UspA family protein